MAHVLIVDDEPDGCEPVARALGRMGHTVECATNGRDALRGLVAGPNPVELLILDLRMPEMDGIKLLEILRSYLRWYKLPVIILSAYVNEDQAKQARLMGVWHIFHKTQYALADLIEAVNDLTATGGGGAQ